MFVKCKLLLTQADKSLEVILRRLDFATDQDGVTFWGKFASSEGGVPPERKAWAFAVMRSELRLLDGGGAGIGMAGGGLKCGEFAALPPSAVLSHAIMVSHGLRPSDSTGVGPGEVLNAAELSVRLRNGPAQWQLLSYQSEGSNVWHNP
jgi:hypothetical protein